LPEIFKLIPASLEKIKMLQTYLNSAQNDNQTKYLQLCIQKTQNELQQPVLYSPLLVNLQTETNHQDAFRDTVISCFMTSNLRVDIGGKEYRVNHQIVREIALYLTNKKKKEYYSDRTVHCTDSVAWAIRDQHARPCVVKFFPSCSKIDKYIQGDTNCGKSVEIVVIAWFEYFITGRFPVIFLQNYDGKTSRNDIDANIREQNTVIDAFLQTLSGTYPELQQCRIRKLYQLNTVQTSNAKTCSNLGATTTKMQHAQVLISNVEISHINKAIQLTETLLSCYSKDRHLLDKLPCSLIMDESDAVPEMGGGNHMPKTLTTLKPLLDQVASEWHLSATIAKSVINYKTSGCFQLVTVDYPTNYCGHMGVGDYKLKYKDLESTTETEYTKTDIVCEMLGLDPEELVTKIKKGRTICALEKYGYTHYFSGSRLVLRAPRKKTRTSEQTTFCDAAEEKYKEKYSLGVRAWLANGENIRLTCTDAIQQSVQYGLSMTLITLSGARNCKTMDHILKQIREKMLQSLQNKNVQGIAFAITKGTDTESQSNDPHMYFVPPLPSSVIDNPDLKTLLQKMNYNCKKDEQGNIISISVKTKFNYQNRLCIPLFIKEAGMKVAIFTCGSALCARAANIRNKYPGEDHTLDNDLYITHQLIDSQIETRKGNLERIAQMIRLKQIMNSLRYGTPQLSGTPDMLQIIQRYEKEKTKSLHSLEKRKSWSYNDHKLKNFMRNVSMEKPNQKPFHANTRQVKFKDIAAKQEQTDTPLKLVGKKRRSVETTPSVESVLVVNPVTSPQSITLKPKTHDLHIIKIPIDIHTEVNNQLENAKEEIQKMLLKISYTTRKKLKQSELKRMLHLIRDYKKSTSTETNKTTYTGSFYKGGVHKSDSIGYHLQKHGDKHLLRCCCIRRQSLFQLELNREAQADHKSCRIVKALQTLHTNYTTFTMAQLMEKSGYKGCNGNPNIELALSCWCETREKRGPSGKQWQLKPEYAEIVNSHNDSQTTAQPSTNPGMQGYESDNGFVVSDDDSEPPPKKKSRNIGSYFRK